MENLTKQQRELFEQIQIASIEIYEGLRKDLPKHELENLAISIAHCVDVLRLLDKNPVE